jgi:adenylate cyclase
VSAAETPEVSLAEAARQAGVQTATLKRWVDRGLVPLEGGRWTPPAVAHARIVARLRDRGHTLDEIRTASESGRLAFGYLEDLFEGDADTIPLDEAATAVGLEPALLRQVLAAFGFPALQLEGEVRREDLRLLEYIATVLGSGFPLVAFLQLVRVYGQAMAQIADAEVRLFHLYVHEPLIRDGVPGLEIAEEMESLAREMLPLSAPIMQHVHHRFLQHFVEQDVVGHMETDLGEAASMELGRLRVAIAFADLAGYTRMTEEVGDEWALGAVEHFVEAVENTLPEEARVIKTIGDEVMVVSSDPASLTDWAVGFQELHTERPLPRIGIHWGEVLYRDGDYYGREVNLAARVAARAAGGEVLVTRTIIEHAGSHLEFDRIAEVKLRGFSEPTELFAARAADD